MKFTDRLEGNVVVFEITGKIMGGDQATLFHGKIHEYINLNKKKIILDFAGVDWINSVGIGMLVSAFTSIRNAGGRLALVNIDKIENILTLTRLITLFEHFDSLDKAMKAL
ncbi:MAG: STAS domain-containing protein [candidate division Zixibacteria bacterium]|nr:STAS domain-containing protein [candidate division Zixibacteria bacterium]